MNPLDKIRPNVRGLRAYTLAAERASVKINQNENPFEAPDSFKQEVLRRFGERAWARYPDFTPASLREKLAAFAGWTPGGVAAGNGSNELLQAALMVTVGEGKRVLLAEPTFLLYRQLVTVFGGEALGVPLDEGLGFDVDALARAVEAEQPDVTIICSPNNPTGCVIPHEDLARLLAAARGLVFVDEAYHEFSGQTAVPLLKDFDNLVVFRTFSKAMAMAALRVGYMLASEELAREIGKAVLPYNLNVFSQTAAEVALDYQAELRRHVLKIVEERGRVFENLNRIGGLWPVASRANFMVVRSGLDPRHVFRELLARDILARDVSGYPMLRDYFRVSVGTPAENDKLIEALKEIFDGK
ncbi:MAG: histidinol-phosphate transaminase [Acidobacteriota bacterium]|nr:histidinol-phosphate transaminase [Acidobacteriota bacterium]